MTEETTYDKDRLRGFIKRCTWKWARTMKNSPHEYIYRGKCQLTDNEFNDFVRAQVYCGEKKPYGRQLIPYLYIDGFKYWTMGDYIINNNTMNRQKLFDEFDAFEGHLPEFYTEEELYQIANCVKQFSMPVFEIGCADGKIVKALQLNPQNYYGVDASKKLIDTFRRTTNGFYRRVSGKAFEETSDKWLNWDGVIVGTFGSPSYCMWQYLSMLEKNGKEYFLMFYKTDFTPAPFGQMHHFNYTVTELQVMFSRGFFYPTENYIIVTSRPIDLKKALNLNGKQQTLFD